MVTAVEAGVPQLTAARDNMTAFQRIIRRKAGDSFHPWLMQARQSLLASFASGMVRYRLECTNTASEPAFDAV
jgi:hypothetical protein